MPEQAAFPTIVLTRQQDHVEAINSTLRNAGHAVHCGWIPEIGDLGDALSQIQPDLLVAFVADVAVDGAQLLKESLRLAGNHLPVLFVREDVDETAMAAAMRLGARDAGSAREPRTSRGRGLEGACGLWSRTRVRRHGRCRAPVS